MFFSWVGILIHFCSIHVFHNMYPRFLKTEITDITVSQFWYPLLEKQCDIVLDYSDCHPSSVCNISALIFLTPVLWFVMMTYVSKVHLFASATMYQSSNGSWCIGIKGEMSGTVCVTFTWDIYIYIYIWVVYSFCLFCCLFIIVTWWYIWCIVWQVASKRKYRHVW